MTINYALARESMVEQQIRPWAVLNSHVLDTLIKLPRDAFTPIAQRALAYADLEIPLPCNQYMMKPVVEGRMLQALELQPHDQVLEIGTGSGYISACLGNIVHSVTSLEIEPELATFARNNLNKAGLGSNIRIEVADALSYQTDLRFDAICVTAAVDVIPAQIVQWLKPEGRLFIVRGQAPAMEAVLVRPNYVNDGQVESLFETELTYLQGAIPASRFVF